jgi:threonine 3-dehydrogenase
MKALVKTRPAPGAEIQTVPDPTPGPEDVVLKVRRAAVCGTDLHIYGWDRWSQGRVHPPLVFGHEMVGEVVAKGARAEGVEVGDLVAVETHIADWTCHLCRRGLAHVCENVQIVGVDRPGAYAEFMSIPARNCWPVPPGLSLEEAAALEPLGNAVHTVLAGEIAGCSAAVTGCGPIGLFSIAVAKACGAGPIIASDVNEYRLDLARKIGADVIVNAAREDYVERVRDVTQGRGVDVVLEMSGNPKAIRDGLTGLRNAGRMSLLGLPSASFELDVTNLIIFKGVTVQGILGRKMFETWRQMTDLIASGRLDIKPAITHVLPIDDFANAMNQLKGGSAGKIVLVPWGERATAAGTRGEFAAQTVRA